MGLGVPSASSKASLPIPLPNCLNIPAVHPIKSKTIVTRKKNIINSLSMILLVTLKKYIKLIKNQRITIKKASQFCFNNILIFMNCFMTNEFHQKYSFIFEYKIKSINLIFVYMKYIE